MLIEAIRTSRERDSSTAFPKTFQQCDLCAASVLRSPPEISIVRDVTPHGSAAELLDLRDDRLGRRGERGRDRPRQAEAHVRRLGHDADEGDETRGVADEIEHQQRLAQRRVVRRDPQARRDLQDLFAIVDADRSGGSGGGDGVDEDDGVEAGEVRRQLDGGRAEVFDHDVAVEAPLRIDEAHDGGADRVVVRKNVTDAVDADAHYCTFTRAMFFPSASNVWTAHAMQGSNEWIVRTTSSGWSGRAPALC